MKRILKIGIWIIIGAFILNTLGFDMKWNITLNMLFFILFYNKYMGES